MKKYFFTFSLFFFLAFIVKAQYETPGTGVEWTFDDLVENSSGVVTEESGLYQINADLTISENDILNITEAINVEIAGEVLVTVLGTWNAVPEETASFKAMSPDNRFEGFRFEETNESVFSNSVIEYGGGIKLVESDMEISDCTVRYFDKSNSTGAIDLFYSTPDIHNNEIYENAGPAIASGATSTSSPQIFNNHIYENNTSNANTPQINLGTSAEDSIRIVGNTITGFYDMAGGIAITTLAGGSIECVIRDNIIENNRYGITCYGSNIASVIKNNQIIDNNLEDDPNAGGSGINFFGDETNTSIVSGNEIRGNLWGITVQNAAKPNLGQLEGDIYNPGMNEIYDNGNSGEIYDFYNNTPDDIMAQNNWWGTADEDEVEDHIFHETDDASLGFVDYLPILSGPTDVSDIDKEAKSIISSVRPVPASEEFTVFSTHDAGIEIYNSAGQLIHQQKRAGKQTTISCGDWTPGIYTVVVSVKNQSETKKVMVAR